MKILRSIFILFAVVTASAILGCDRGLEPPQPEVEISPTGAISGTVHYSGEWPPSSQLKDLRFIPLETVPQSMVEIIADFENLKYSDRLSYNVESDTFLVDDLENGVYLYNAVVQQYGGIFDWRPVGVYDDNDGIIIIEGDTVNITIDVDFDNLPPFPPE